MHTSEEERRSIFRVDALAFETGKLRADLEEFRVSLMSGFQKHLFMKKIKCYQH